MDLATVLSGCSLALLCWVVKGVHELKVHAGVTRVKLAALDRRVTALERR